VTVYLLEAYVPGSSAADLTELAEHLNVAAEAVLQEGLQVRYLRSTYVPEDETCFHYIEVASASVAERFARSAELSFDRILEARNAGGSTSSNPKEGR
jgi:hypothetical protein